MNQHYRSSAPPPAALARYDSAPGSFFADLSPTGSDAMMSRFFTAGAGDTRLTATNAGGAPQQLRRSYGLPEIEASPPVAAVSGVCGPPLIRHSSSPTGFFSHLVVDQGSSSTRGFGSFSQVETGSVHSLENRRLRSQWSFSRQDSLSQISELSIPEIEENVNCTNSSDEGAYISSNIPLGTWDDNNAIVFSAHNKRAKDNDGNIVRRISNIESQFSLPTNSMDYLQLQPESVQCKVRAKRGCATHPRSIAERERRTRISKRLRKLQDLVPNMDKQTSTSDMLELAVKHINELQNQLHRLKQDQAKCTCGNKQGSTIA